MYVQRNWTIDLVTPKSVGVIHSLCRARDVWCLLNKDFSRYWADSILLYSVWRLTLWLKSIGTIYYLGEVNVPCFMSVEQMVLKILYRAISYYVQVDPWPSGWKINHSGNLLPRATTVKSLVHVTVKQRILEILSRQDLIYRPTDRWK